MALPQWQPVRSLAMPNVNPNQAINVASNAFGNISDTIQADEAAAQEAAYRQGLLEQQQAELEWEQGEDDRAKQRVTDMSKSFQNVYGQGIQAQKDAFRVNDDNVAAFAQEMNLPEAEARAKAREHILANPELFVNPNQLEGDVIGRMADAGYMGDDVANLLSNQLSQSGFNKASADTQKLMLDALQKPEKLSSFVAKSGSGKGTSASEAKEIATKGFQDRKKYVDDRLGNLFSKGSPGIIQRVADALPFNDPDVYVDDAKAAISDMERASGIASPFILDALESMLDDDTLEFRLSGDMQSGDALQQKGFQDIVNLAKQKQFDAYGGAVPGGAGNRQISLNEALNIANQSQQEYRNSVNDIVASGSFHVATAADRMSSLREAFGLTKKQAKTVDKKLASESKKQAAPPTESDADDDGGVDRLLDNALAGGTPPPTVEKVVEDVTGKKPPPAPGAEPQSNALMDALVGKPSDANVPGSFRHDAVEPTKAMLGSLYDRLINAGGDAIGAVANTDVAKRFRFAQQFEKDTGRYPTEEELQAFLSQ